MQMATHTEPEPVPGPGAHTSPCAPTTLKEHQQHPRPQRATWARVKGPGQTAFHRRSQSLLGSHILLTPTHTLLPLRGLCTPPSNLHRPSHLPLKQMLEMTQFPDARHLRLALLGKEAHSARWAPSGVKGGATLQENAPAPLEPLQLLRLKQTGAALTELGSKCSSTNPAEDGSVLRHGAAGQSVRLRR